MWDANDLKNWEQIKNKGRANFILKRGIIAFGGICAAIAAPVAYGAGEGDTKVVYAVLAVAGAFVAGGLFANVTWNGLDKLDQDRIRKEKWEASLQERREQVKAELAAKYGTDVSSETPS